MGKVLQVRVSAMTYDPEDVYRQWPGASKLAWGEKALADLKSVGVRELSFVLRDKWKFSENWPQDLKTSLATGVAVLQDLDQDLEDALADRQADAADRITYALEDALDELEDIVSRYAGPLPAV